MKYYLVRAIFGGGTDEEKDMFEKFITGKKWSTGYDDGTYSNVINNVDKGDMLIMAGREKTILCIGRCTKNDKDGKNLSVDWFPKFKNFILEDDTITRFQSTINKINKEEFKQNILKQATKENPNLNKYWKDKDQALARALTETANRNRIIQYSEIVEQAMEALKAFERTMDYTARSTHMEPVKSIMDQMQATQNRIQNMLEPSKSLTHQMKRLQKFNMTPELQESWDKLASIKPAKENSDLIEKITQSQNSIQELEQSIEEVEPEPRIAIKSLTLDNVKAFANKQTIDFDEKNVLIYGENGSGKSSIVSALKQLLEFNYNKDIKYGCQNIFTRELQYNITMECTGGSKHECHNEHDPMAVNHIPNTDLANTYFCNPFLEFRDIMQIYFNDYLNQDDDSTHGKNLYSLFRYILRNLPVSGYGTGIHLLEHIGECEDSFEKMKTTINDLRIDSNEFLEDYFDEHIEIVDYITDGVARQIFLDLKYHNESVNDYTNILNEARLSSLAISIYLLLLKHLYSIYTTPFKILVLDDLLISMDMGHRIPVLDILEEQFSDYQIIFLTHDKSLYDVVKKRTRDSKKWKYLEMYSNPNAEKIEIQDISTEDDDENQQNEPLNINPIIIDGKSTYLEYAQAHFKKYEYTVAGLYVRKSLEEICKDYLPNSESIKVNVKEKELDDLLNTVKNHFNGTRQGLPNDPNVIDLITKINYSRGEILNPSAHDDNAPLYKKEVKIAIDLAIQLSEKLNQKKEEQQQAAEMT